MNLRSKRLYQVWGIGSSDGAMGLDKSRLELCHLFRCGDSDAIVLLHCLVHTRHFERHHIREHASFLCLVCQCVGAEGKAVLFLPWNLGKDRRIFFVSYSKLRQREEKRREGKEKEGREGIARKRKGKRQKEERERWEKGNEKRKKWWWPIYLSIYLFTWL